MMLGEAVLKPDKGEAKSLQQFAEKREAFA